MRALLLLLVALAACSAPPLAPETQPDATPPESMTTPPVMLAADTAPSAARAGMIARAMQMADTEAAGDAIAHLLRDAGLDFPDDLSWDVQAFDAPLNYYNSWTHQVAISAMPTAEQTPVYWQAWSALLSGGEWSPEAFFRDAEEGQRLAAFNQAVLMAHELGHALAYRYAVNPRTDDGNVNCQELLADRVAVAVIDRLARADARYAELRERYLTLLASLNQAVPEPHRYAMASRQRLMNECRSIQVANPTADPTSLVPYASAFFERHRLLHDGAPPEPLALLADSVFLSQLRASLASAPAARGSVQVETTGQFSLPRANQISNLGDELRRIRLSLAEFDYDSYEFTTLAFGVTPEATVWSVVFESELRESEATSFNTVRATDHSSGAAWEAEIGPDPAGKVRSIQALVALSDSVFVGMGQLAAIADEADTSFHLFEIRDDGIRWSEALSITPEDEPRLVRTPAGHVILITRDRAATVDLVTLQVDLGEASGGEAYRLIVGLEDDGTTYYADRDALPVMSYGGDGTMPTEPGGTILYAGRDSEAGRETWRLAGSGYPSTRDGTDPDSIAFQEIASLQPLADGRVVIIERTPFDGDRNAVYIRILGAHD